jgi:hypothetical protein
MRVITACSALAVIGSATCFAPMNAPALKATGTLHGLGASRAPLISRAARKAEAATSLTMRIPGAVAAGAIATAAPRALMAQNPVAAAAGLFTLLVGLIYVLLKIPSRSYVEGDNTVGKEYDAWTEEGLLEYYWVIASLPKFSRR